jgi:hypothetical protein
MFHAIDQEDELSSWTPSVDCCFVERCDEMEYGRVRSLYVMLRFYAAPFISSTRLITRIYSIFKRANQSVVLEETIHDNLHKRLETLYKQVTSMNLPVTQDSIRRLQHALSLQVPCHKLAPLLSEIENTLHSELKSIMLFQIPSYLVQYYHEQEPLFGEAVATNFPSASYDIAESGKCLAAGRNTACVFHLMRVLEIGLTALGQVFGISLAHTNWQPAIQQIEKKIREMGNDPNKSPTWKEDQEFYAQAASHFMVFKDAWRNYTAHARGKYDEQEAEMLLRNVRAFMQKLATRLSE